MGVLTTILTVLFMICALLLIIVILLQSDKSAGMGILGGSSQSAFGSSTADVITKITGVLVALFMLGSVGLSILESYKAKTMEKEFISGEPVSELLDKKQQDGQAGKENQPQNTSAPAADANKK